MLSITIACIGKLKEDYLREASAEYAKRLGAYCKLNILEIDEAYLPENPSRAQIEAAMNAEGKKLSARMPSGSYLIALTIEGKMRSSTELAHDIEQLALSGDSSLVFIIGGPWGLADEAKQRANLQLSLSRMTFPHQLVRVMLLEQIYRAFQIIHKGKYHK
jgi:23S rRNA (pseudouridine1915-N3)-methyltransferase